MVLIMCSEFLDAQLRKMEAALRQRAGIHFESAQFDPVKPLDIRCRRAVEIQLSNVQ